MTPGTILLVGFGCIGQALAPLLLQQFKFPPQSIHIICADENGRNIAENHGFNFQNAPLTEQNYSAILAPKLHAGDLLINVSVNVSSLALIDWCQAHDVLYLDTCIEPWAGGYRAANAATSNYALRQAALALHQPDMATAIVAHGANPGLVSHFLKAGLLELARIQQCASDLSWAELAQALEIQTIHIAEYDSQFGHPAIQADAFANTWSVDGLLAEAWQVAELGWGSHERTLPQGAQRHLQGDGSGICLDHHGGELKVKSWTPASGEQTAYLIPHHEALSIAHLLTIPGISTDRPRYRPTVYYAYHPSPATCQSLEHWQAHGFAEPKQKILLQEQLQGGFDELGVLFIFPGGAYWYGSTLSLAEARALAPYNNATSLQVVAGILGALDWMFRHPRAGIIEAESLDYTEVLAIAQPFLGQITGALSHWQPGQPGQPGDLQFATFRQASFEEALL